MTHAHCPNCGLHVATQDGRTDDPATGLKPANGSTVITSPFEAPRVLCPCGRLIVLLKGSLV